MSEWISGDAPGVTAGSRIAGYLLERLVGQGPTGVVFQARDEQRGLPAALKVIAPDLAADQAFASRLLGEAEAAKAVGEPHILPVLQSGQADGRLFVAMPYIRGGDARSLVRREGALPPERAVPLIWRIASALDAAHTAGLVHGDVKPGNVLVESRPGQPELVYLSDFGQRRGLAPGPVLAGTERASQALDCIAPEQAEGKQADGRADQYALACVAFELLTGVRAFPHDQPALSSPADSPVATSLRPNLPPAVDHVLGRALAQVAGYRYGSCREFADALRAAFGPLSGQGQPEPAAAAVPSAGGPGVPAAAAAGPAAAAPVPAAAVATAPAGAGMAPDGTLPGSAGSAFPGPTMAGAGVPGPSLPGGEPWLVYGRRRRVRIAPIAFIVAAVVIVAGLVAGLLVVLRGGAATPKPTALHIAARTATKPETGDVWTVFGLPSAAGAQIYGTVRGAVSGEVARLYAQPFPFSAAPAPAGTPATLHPKGKAGTASYSFHVTPSLATRYHVKVFQSRSASTALASTATTTVYVASGFSPTSSLAPCKRPVCHETLTGDVLVPASAISTEIAKPVYAYFGLNLSKSGTPPQPAGLELGAGDAKVSTKLVSADEYQITVTFTFSVGKKGGYNWGWNACTKDTEALDGIGLPGSHGCGDKTIPNQANYIG
jgi:Protein kinase domain